MRLLCSVGSKFLKSTPRRANDRIVLYIVGFDVPSNNATNCLIKFTMPNTLPDGYQWTASGSGKFDVYMVTSLIVPGELSWNNRPRRYPTLDPQPLFRITVCILFVYTYRLWLIKISKATDIRRRGYCRRVYDEML